MKNLEKIEKDVRKTLKDNFPNVNFRIRIVMTECIIHWKCGPTEGVVLELVKEIAGDLNISCHRKEKGT